MRFLFLGTPDFLTKLVQWAQKASTKVLERVVACLPDADVLALTPKPEIAVATAKKLAAIECEKTIPELRALEAELVTATCDGEPKFSWVMSKAMHDDPRIETFLRSSKEYEVIILGRGIGHARLVAASINNGQKALSKYFRASSGKYDNNYSAKAIESGTGSKAAVRVTKTKHFFEADVKAFRDKLPQLKIVRARIYERTQLLGMTGGRKPDALLGSSSEHCVMDSSDVKSEPTSSHST